MNSVYQFDARGLTCPLAFVLVKQQLLKKSTKSFILDDDITLKNFVSYLKSENISFEQSVQGSDFNVEILD
ncbi:hypothetical protein GCM10009128_03390 [Psychrosphaera haliotis]